MRGVADRGENVRSLHDDGLHQVQGSPRGVGLAVLWAKVLARGSSGKMHAQSTVITIAPTPPNTTAPVAPSNAAARPDCISPSSFEAEIGEARGRRDAPAHHVGRVQLYQACCGRTPRPCRPPPSKARKPQRQEEVARQRRTASVAAPNTATAQSIFAADIVRERPQGELQRDQRPRPPRAPRASAEPFGADMEDVAREHRQHRGRPAEQHREQIERDAAEQEAARASRTCSPRASGATDAASLRCARADRADRDDQQRRAKQQRRRNEVGQRRPFAANSQPAHAPARSPSRPVKRDRAHRDRARQQSWAARYWARSRSSPGR